MKIVRPHWTFHSGGCQSEDLRAGVMAFLQSTYEVGAARARWDQAAWER